MQEVHRGQMQDVVLMSDMMICRLMQAADMQTMCEGKERKPSREGNVDGHPAKDLFNGCFI